MKGYYKMPRATAETVDADGWLHSGDLAVRDENGNYRITGRLKDMIIRGGENIYPKEIEEFIYTHPKVQDVQVIGVPDKKYGEEAYAAIILKEGESMTEAEMRAYITDHMARHKVPRYIAFTDSFPMNAPISLNGESFSLTNTEFAVIIEATFTKAVTKTAEGKRSQRSDGRCESETPASNAHHFRAGDPKAVGE